MARTSSSGKITTASRTSASAATISAFVCLSGMTGRPSPFNARTDSSEFDSNDEYCLPTLSRSVNVAHVPDVQQIEVAVGQRNAFARASPLLDPLAKFVSTGGFCRGRALWCAFSEAVSQAESCRWQPAILPVKPWPCRAS